MSLHTLARGSMVEKAIGEQFKVLGSITLLAGCQAEQVEVKGQAEGGVLDTPLRPHDPALGGCGEKINLKRG